MGLMLFDRWGASDDEVASSLPGDDLLTEPYLSATRSITVDGTPTEVLAWLTQMGTGRAGWYSYDLIDNFGRPSARRLNEAWRVTKAGDSVPAGPISFAVVHLSAGPPAELVLAVPDRSVARHRIGFTLAYRAVACRTVAGRGGAQTRLISRARADVTGPLGPLINPLLAAGDGLMVRRQLLGLQNRCGR